MVCKPCLEKGREAIDRNLNPYYNPDDDTIRAPLNPNPLDSADDNDSNATSSVPIEMVCKPCLEKGREAIDRNLNPYYNPDDDTIRAPLNPNPLDSADDNDSNATSSVVKAL
ncbi:unnamed protein product [Ilex paraguariensis]|uniref:Uncharacterized protein n=1 Tax=Ilex paraguariensis TaxID=185542 RepID=A0ABC8SZJ1_9AQUA